MPTKAQHLLRRGAIYHWRRRLSAPLNEILGRSHFDVSLRTSDPARARALARRLSVALDLLVEQLRAMSPSQQPTPGQLNFVLKELFDSILKDGEYRRNLMSSDGHWLGHADRELIRTRKASEHLREVYNRLTSLGVFDEGDLPEDYAKRWDQYSDSNVIEAVYPLLEKALEASGVSLDFEYPSNLGLCQDALSLAAQAYRVDLERWDGRSEHGQSPPDWLDRKYPRAPALVRSWAGELNREEVDFFARTIEDVAEEYIERHLRHARARKTERDWQMAVRYFVSLVGNLRVGDITETHVDRFREQLLDVPAEYGKGIYARLTPMEAIAKRSALKRHLLAAQRERKDLVAFEGRRWSIAQASRKTATLTRKTANKHLSFFTKLWRSRVVPKILRPMSPFAGSLYPKSEVAHDHMQAGRASYTSEELTRLFTSPVWTGCRSLERRADPGPLIVPDARFWCPLIAIFTGMRREEICQLKATDFDQHDDIWFLRVQPTEGRRLKTPAARRDIPLHSELVKLGLLDFVAYRKAGYLFPELRPSQIDQALGDSLGKWFYHYRRRVGIDRDETDFHSFRTTFTQYLRLAGVPLDHIKPITGHQENDITLRHYAPSFGLAQRKDVVEKFKLGVSFLKVYGQMAVLLAEQDRHEETCKRPTRSRHRADRAGAQAD